MSAEDLHMKILQILDEQITDDDFKKIRFACKPNIPPAQLQRIKTMRDLITTLEDKGLIGVGNYTLLLKILNDHKMLRVKRLVEDVAKGITSPLSIDCGSATQCDDDDFDCGSATQCDDDDFTYSKQKMGLVSIINIMDFGNHAEYRSGSEKDMENVEALFNSGRGFRGCYSVLTSINCTLDQLKAELTLCQEKLRTGVFDQFICFIFSHGDEQGILTSDGQHIMPEEIINRFKGDVISQMAGHPKVFIFQACRGEKAQSGQRVDQAGDTKLQKNLFIERDVVSHVVPVDADIVTAFSTTKGFVSLRDVFDGSLYIQNICEVFRGYKQDHLLDLLTRVHQRVSRKTGTLETGEFIKQMPSFESTFTNKMYLHQSQQ